MVTGLERRRTDERSRRWMMILGLALGLIVLAGFPLGLSTAGAQEDAAPPAEEAEPAAPAEPAAAPAAESAGEEAPPPRRSFLTWLVEASGYYGLVLGVLSVMMVALILMHVFQVRRDVLLSPEFLEAFEQKLAAKDYQGGFDLARNDDSLVARVLAAGLSKLNRGYSEAIEGMQEELEVENMALEHRLSYLAMIGSIGPMIGLMGTVHGMIMSFEEIAQSAVSPKPSDLAEGISMALFTTLEGLVVAIPAIIAYGIFRNRVSQFILEVGMISEGLMARLPVAKPKPAA